MYATQLFIYQQITRVLMMDIGSGETFPYRYDPVYAKKLTINKGVDQVLLFEFVNQEQKPVNISESTMLFRLINQQGTAMLLQKPVEVLNAATGRAKVTIAAADTINILAQPCTYSIAFTRGNLTLAVFSDAQAGANAPAVVVNSVLPQFVPSTPLTLPTTQLASQVSYGGDGYENYPDWANQYGNDPGWYNYYYQNTEYYSSQIVPRNAITTIQMDLINYTGTIKAQWAQDYQSVWVNATESTTYYNETRTIYLNVMGWYPLLRLAFNNSLYSTPRQPGIPAIAYAVCEDGMVTQIILASGGSGYLAPPMVSIVGDGSGATAEAVINSDGTVTDIIITNPGSGYWPIPSGGVNPAGNPVPPPNQGALVIISTGLVVNMYYR